MAQEGPHPVEMVSGTLVAIGALLGLWLGFGLLGQTFGWWSDVYPFTDE